MKITVASGKGGTGKTTIATSLALSLVDPSPVWYLDCDVEAPNGHLLLKPDFTRQSQAVVQIPQIQMDRCVLCAKCVEVCQFHALAKVGKNILVFPQLCHGCGSCTWNCPEGAIIEIPKPIGVLKTGITSEGIHFAHGVLNISEPMPTPVIHQLKRFESPPEEAIVIIDAPPGASCAVVETLRGADFALLVIELTPFGLHDLKQMLGIVREMGIPVGIVINRDGISDNHVEKFLSENDLPILLRIPYLRKWLRVASGVPLIQIMPEYRSISNIV